jgi:NADPH:quinone reductase-like Zn-dependent oxidoreductase
VGTFAVQLARSFGATVTAVCSTRNVALARSLGADHVVDYTQEDFTQSDRRYDLILVANGNRPLTAYRRALRPGGRCVVAGGAIRPILTATLLGPVLSLAWGVSVRGLIAQPSQRQQDLAFVSGLLEAGDVVPGVDRCFPLRELPEALHYHAAGLACGKVVITLSDIIQDKD